MEKQWKEMRGKMEHITLFTDILPEEQERMRVCFHAREMTCLLYTSPSPRDS